jgi:hypothetical protein
MLILRGPCRAAVVSTFALGVGLGACGSGAVDRPPGQGGNGVSTGLGGTISPGGSSGAVAVGGGQTGGQVVVGNPGVDGGSGQGCQNLQVVFEPKIPTVFVLADRSGSMFDSMVWVPLRTGVLKVIQDTQAEIRFGFAAFTGQAGGTCPIFDAVPQPSIGLNNYNNIAAFYGTLDKPAVLPKPETPTTLALKQAQSLLIADNAPGEKYILFVTDGEPDFCDDVNHICAVDSVVHELQVLKQAGITTFVFGLKSALSDISVPSLQAFANAGAGQPALAPIAQTPAPINIYYQCNGSAAWMADLSAAGKTGMMTSIGDYATTGGNATLYNPDLTDPVTGQATLVSQLTSVIAGVKSCHFDLSGKIEVDVNQLNLASVAIQGRAVPLDSMNGWRMNTGTQLELVGDACTAWRRPENTQIDFNFPCGIIIIK